MYGSGTPWIPSYSNGMTRQMQAATRRVWAERPRKKKKQNKPINCVEVKNIPKEDQQVEETDEEQNEQTAPIECQELRIVSFHSLHLEGEAQPEKK